MGEVYRARDTRLDRTVAIKIMIELGRADPERRERFEREARLVASLDHPHICALHDIGRARPTSSRPDEAASGVAAEIDFLVMPYLDGETLSARLKSGPLPMTQALEIAGQIADALDRAHRAGIVHRDLKPGNVMLTKTGARLLDFGLARLDAPATAEDPASVVTRPALTTIGAIMGTLPYMAPEQLNGRTADARSDIWAFGCLLYEMLGGRRPFAGETEAVLIGTIMASTPASLSQIAPSVPRAIEQIVSGALVKDRDERWQSMRDVKRALALATSGAVDAGAATAGGRARRWPRVVIAMLGVATVLLAVLALQLWRHASVPPLVRFDVEPVGSGVITNFTDTNPYFAASPDGTQIAFVATTESRADIWIKRLDHDTPERLADTAGALSPFWSPDGQSIAFFAGGTLRRKALAGGAAQVLCKVEGTGQNGAWNAAGVILFNEWGLHQLMRVSENGGTPVKERDGQLSYGWLSFLPDGHHFLYAVPDLANSDPHAFVGSLGSADAIPVAGVTSKMEFVAGHLLFWREGSLVAQPFDLATYQLTGQPVSLADGIHAFVITAFAAFSAAPGLLVYQAGPVARRLVWTDRQGLESEPVGPAAEIYSVRLSPGASSIAFSARDPRPGTNDIFIYEVGREVVRRLTSDRGTENSPMWSPDGKTIVYAADRHGPPNLQRRSADGAGQETEVVSPSTSGPQVPGSFTPDGRALIFVQPNPGTGLDVMMMSVDAQHPSPPVAVVATKGREYSPHLSADGKWLAYQSNESGRTEVYVQPLYDPHGRRQVSRDGGIEPRWRGDGKELYYVAGPARTHLIAVDIVTSGATIEPGAPRLLFIRHSRVVDYDVIPDGKRFLFVAIDPVAERGTLSAVVNWTKLIK
jgi:Tol biopolymer transport system component